MKRLLYLAIAMTMIACTAGIKSISRGLENEAFLSFVGNPSNYKSGVEVTVDDNTQFVAEVIKEKVGKVKGKVYAISTGKHQLTVKYSGKVIYNNQIFVGAQETKKIVLP